MLAIQPKLVSNQKTAFKGEYDYQEAKNTWQDRKAQLDEVIADTEAVLPKPVKGGLKFLSILASGILGGMATAWGAKRTIGLVKSDKVQKLVAKFTKPAMEYAKAAQSKVSGAIKKTGILQKIQTKIGNFYDTLSNTSIGKQSLAMGDKVQNNKFVKLADEFTSKYYNKATNAVGQINGKKIENFAVGLVGVSGGVASGVTAIKGEQ